MKDVAGCCSVNRGEIGGVGGRFFMIAAPPPSRPDTGLSPPPPPPPPPPLEPPDSKLLCSNAARAAEAAVKDSWGGRSAEGGREREDVGAVGGDLIRSI